MNIVKTYLQRFTREMIADIKYIMKANSDNHMKADILSDYLEPLGFREIGLGTNIIVYGHKKECNKKGWYDVVYKIALDEFGLSNNLDDVGLSREIPQFAQVYEVREDGLISVQEYCKPFQRVEQIQQHYGRIFKMLKKLSKDYLLIDLSPKNLKNYGVDKEGNLRIIDGSDLIRLEDTAEIECQAMLFNKKSKDITKTHKCRGKLHYDDRYHMLVCEECGEEHNPVVFRRKFKEVDITKTKYFSTGFEPDANVDSKNFKFEDDLTTKTTRVINTFEAAMGISEERKFVIDDTDETLGDEDSREVDYDSIEDDDNTDTVITNIPEEVPTGEVTITYEQLKAIFGGREVKILDYPNHTCGCDKEASEVCGGPEVGEPEPEKISLERVTDVEPAEVQLSEVANTTVGQNPEPVEEAPKPAVKPKRPSRAKSVVAKETTVEVTVKTETDTSDEDVGEEPYVQVSAPVRVEKIKPIGGNLSIGDDDSDADSSPVYQGSKKDYPAKKKKKSK